MSLNDGRWVIERRWKMSQSWVHLGQSDLEKIAQKLLKDIDHHPHCWIDVEETVKVLKEVYDRGRSRGAYESCEGASC